MSLKNIKSRAIEIEVPEKKPFEFDKLERGKIAAILTDIVSFYGQSGCVLALNGDWGSGKTTFVRMWKQALKNNDYKTLYFNAWNSDYADDPLLALVSELKELSPNNEKINSIAGKAGRIMGRVLLTVSKGLIKKTVGVECDTLNEALDATEEIGKEYLAKFEEQKETVEEFKNDVRKFVADNAAEKPVVFFVDELDRCNPHYAVAVLERIKHLFDIPNIIFVLAINKKELCNAIQGFYGSTNINSEEYLRRFIDIEYTLSKPKMDVYCKHLYNEYGFGEFFENENRKQYFRGDREIDSFMRMAISISEAAQTNLRQLERVFAYARLALMQFSSNTYVIPDIYFLLCFWKVMKPEFYRGIRSKEYTNQEFLTKVENILPETLLVTDKYQSKNRGLYYTIASLIYCYDITSTEINDVQRKSLELEKNELTGEEEFKIQTNKLEKELFQQALKCYYMNSRNDQYSYGLKFLFDKIDLLERFRV